MKRAMIAGLSILLMTGTVHGHGNEQHNETKPEDREMVETAFGMTGDPKKVSRTIKVVMNDEMKFVPNTFSINVGETVRFVVENAGEVLHEMVLGQEKDLVMHAKLMMDNPGMEHEEPYMTHVQPGKGGEIVWTFTKAGTFEFGCLIPGHFDAGMRGTVVVQ